MFLNPFSVRHLRSEVELLYLLCTCADIIGIFKTLDRLRVRLNVILFSRLRSLCGNVSTASHLPYLYELHVYTPVESIHKDVLDCELHPLGVSSCQECGRQSASAALASVDPLYGTVCREHVRAASKESSFQTVINITRRRCGVLRF